MPKSNTTAIIGIKTGAEIQVISTQNPYFVGMAKQWQAEIEKLPVLVGKVTRIRMEQLGAQ